MWLINDGVLCKFDSITRCNEIKSKGPVRLSLSIGLTGWVGKNKKKMYIILEVCRE